jgi:dTDP-glucose 4,6-dehydratase
LQRFRQIVDGTTNILDLTIATGATRFLLTSSGGIYGPQPNHLDAIPEDWLGSPSLQAPQTAYSQAKRTAEHLSSLYRDSYGLEVVIARCFSFVGLDLPLNVHFAIGNFIRDALFADRIIVSGDGTSVRSYLDQRDLANWLWSLLLHGYDGEVYNVGSSMNISIRDLAFLVRDLLSPSLPIKINSQPDPLATPNRYVPCVRKALVLHSLDSTYSLEQSIHDAAAFHALNVEKINSSDA